MDGGEAIRHQAITALSRSVAHTLGNMLTGLTLTLELLETTALSAEQKRYVARCLQLTERLNREKYLLTALGGSHFAPGWVETLPLLTRARDRLVHASDLHITCAVQPGAEQLWGDAVLLEEALAQLVRNAADALVQGGRFGLLARPETGPHAGAAPAEARAEPHAPRAAGGIELLVWDEGTGLGAVPRASHKPPGMGMGLVFVETLIERVHGGRFVLEPRPPRGAQARIFLPAPAATVTPEVL